MGDCYLCDKHYPGTDPTTTVVVNTMDRMDGRIKLLKMSKGLYDKFIAFTKVEAAKEAKKPSWLARWFNRLIGRHQPDANLFLVSGGQFYQQCRYCDRAIQKEGNHWRVM